jgi:hypothetical protein
MGTGGDPGGGGLSSQSVQPVAASAANGSFLFSTLKFVDTQGVSFATAAGGIRATVRTDYQSSGPYLTVQSVQPVGASAANGAFAFSTLQFANSNGVSFSTGSQGIFATVATNYQAPGAYLTTAALSQNSSKYAGTAAAITGGSVTLNTSGLSLNLPVYQSQGAYLTTARASSDAIGLNSANSNVTWTLNSSGLSLDARGYAGTATAATNASLTVNSGGISISVAAGGTGGGAAAPDRWAKEIMNGERLTTCAALSATQFSNRPIICPFWMDGTGLVANTLRFLVSVATSSNRSIGGTFHAGLYSAANSTQLSLIGSDSISYSITATSQGSAYQGAAMMDFTGMSNVTIAAEGRYALGFMVRPVSANITWMPASIYGADNMPAISRVLLANTTAATGSTGTAAVVPFWGVYSTTTAALPGTIGIAQINGGNSASLVDLYAVIREN